MLNRWILGMNKRNNTYIKEFNPEKGIRLANNKIQTKKFLTQRWIPVPQTIAHIKTRNDRIAFDFSSITSSTFVIKPNKGSKGSGIFIIKERRKGEKEYEFFISNKRISEHDLKQEAAGIFDGSYSSRNKSDTILLEDRLIPGLGFAEFCEYGLADMRIIIFNLVPIIAMLRMPTKESGGKANLAQWGIWLGLDIVTGKITSLYRQGKSYTTQFPEQRQHFKGKKIPYRQEIIQYSANAQYFVNIGYLGMDRVITNKWPKLLEINARSGLEIQNITGKPLLTIMKKIEDIEVTTPQKWIEISKSLFSDERINEIKDQHIVYLSQTGKLSYQKSGKKRSLPITITVGLDKLKNYTSDKVLKKIMGADSVSVDLGHHDTIFKDISLLSSDDIKWNKIILWQQSLQQYYIKPIHKSKVNTRILNPDCFIEDELASLKLLDEKIHSINKYLNLAQILRPTNYLDEFDAFVSHHGDYNPHFTYDFPKYKELNVLQDQINELDNKYRIKEYFDSSFANLFFEKLDEMSLKIKLIKAYKKQDFWLIDRYNRALFGEIKPELLALSKERIQHSKKISSKHFGTLLSSKEAIDYIKDYCHELWLEHTRVRVDHANGSRIAVGFGKFATIKIRDNAKFRTHKLSAQLAHEVDVHISRYLHGKKTWWHILATGTAWYLETEEGLAVYLADQKLQTHLPDYDSLAKYKNYYRVDQASRLNFSDLAQCIHETYNAKWAIRNYKLLFNRVLKFVKGKKDTSISNTGIIFGKNIVYLNGYHTIQQLISQQPDIIKRLLKYGKIKREDLALFK